MKRTALILIVILAAMSFAALVSAAEAPVGGVLPAATIAPPTKTPTPSPVPTQAPMQSQKSAGAQSVSVPNADATCHYDATHGVYLVLMCEVWGKGDSMYVPWKPGCTAPRYSQCR